ncbi:uncharacterized protein LOC126679182 isoform X2 [Mercurialis annua]|uniref:uncharacterized protein LOC126679182 isoform X2 n=1 Tax=Mercurialis annua TaxID=3986 RepID=UPI00215FDEFB|nr:uncharacterized protein LOC126679182 isoform X2 [Mercurialis annua]
MDLSEDWKSGFPIGIVFDPPLLLSDSAGPLFFNPNPNSLTQLFNSPLFPPILNPPPNLSLSRFIATSTAHDAPIPDSTASAIASVFGPQFHDEIAETLLGHNHLQFLKIPLQNDVLVFFSTGLNHDQVGFLLLSVKDGSLCAVGDSKGGVFVADKDLNQKIVGILVNPDGDFEGSFWNCEFSLFCYGPSLPARKGSIALEISEISKSSYAWELPSDLLLSGNKCRCGNCLVREEFLKDSLPEWIDWQQKKERILGFGILSKDLSSLLFESDEYGGFTLIRLMSSGKLELQRYYASWDLVTKLEEGHRDPLLCNEDNLLFSLDNEKYRFPKIFKYLKLDYLSAYINGNLLQALDLNLIKTCEDPQQKESFSIEFHEILCEKLNTCGFGKFRTFPAINAVFNNINLPTSVHEVAMSSMWASLPMELLQLAFSSYNEFLEALLDQKKVALEFLDVPDIPQLPPFFLRKPSSRSSKWSSKVPRSEVLVGPVIPLPILITLHELRNGCPNSQEGFSRFSSEIELNNQCKEVMQVARVMAMPDSTIELRDHDDDDAVSLGDDRDDIWADSEKPKPLCLYRPVAELGSVEGHKESKSVHKDDKFGFMLAKVHAKDPKNNKKMESMGQELFDDLCPIHMKFDAADMEFSSKEMKAYNSLKREFSKWQEGFKPFQGFRDRFEN